MSSPSPPSPTILSSPSPPSVSPYSSLTPPDLTPLSLYFLSHRPLLFSLFVVLYCVILPFSPFLSPILLFIIVVFLYLRLTVFRSTPQEHGDGRRRLLHKFPITQVCPNVFPFDPSVYTKTEHYLINSRGELLYTCQYFPTDHQPKAILLVLHGYSDHSSWFHLFIAQLFVSTFHVAVFYIDHIGHGKSDGLHMYLPDFNYIVDDAELYMKWIEERYGSLGLKIFVYSESMGGAIALNLSRRIEMQRRISGLILSAPMCKIADEMKPPAIVITILLLLSRLFPKLPLVPSPTLLPHVFKSPVVRVCAELSPIQFRFWPRLGTAASMLKTSLELEERGLDEITVPFLVIHGDKDIVTDPKVSEALFKRAKSKDKKLKLYRGVWHSTLLGEVKETRDMVLNDIGEWMQERL